jgi:phosphatidylinositol alpha-1,6-mannosyltransferase
MPALLVTHGFPPDVGGIQTYLHVRCLGTPEEVVVAAPNRPGAAEFDREQPFCVFRWPSPPGSTRPMQLAGPLVTGLKAARTESVEWIECGQALPVGLPVYVLARRLRVAYLVWAHGQELFRAQQAVWSKLGSARLQRFVLRNAKAVMANSGATAELVESLGVPASRIFVLAPGVLPGSVEPAGGPGLRDRLELGDRPLVLSVSRLVPRKGHDVLLEAVARAREEVPDLACVIVGEGPHRARLEARARQLGQTGHVFLPGKVDDLAEAYSTATVFALLSRHDPARGWWEGFGIVFREAGLHGVPVVATRAGGIADAVEDGETGFLVPPDDPAPAAAAIVRLVKDTELGRRLGERGREAATTHPDWSIIREAMTT